MEDIRKFFSTTKGKVIGVIAVLVILGAVSGSGDKKSESNGATKTVVATAAPVDPAKLATDKATLAELKKKFTYKYDEFEKIGWYDTKSQAVANTFNNDFLEVYVSNTGNAYLMDQYYDTDWLFHTRVEVSINGTIYKSDDISTSDNNNSQNNSSGYVWENISYTAGRDNGIIKAIAESGTAPVKVRFSGGSGGVYDFTLKERDRQAIKDSYELSNLIKETGDTGTTS